MGSQILTEAWQILHRTITQLPVGWNQPAAKVHQTLQHCNTLYSVVTHIKISHQHLCTCPDLHQTTSLFMVDLFLPISPTWWILFSHQSTATKAFSIITFHHQIQTDRVSFPIFCPLTHLLFTRAHLVQTILGLAQPTLLHQRPISPQHQLKYQLIVVVVRWLAVLLIWSVVLWEARIWKLPCCMMTCPNTAPKNEFEGKTE